MANGSLYTISAEIRDNMSSQLNNINAKLRDSKKAANEAKNQISDFQRQISSITGSLSGFANSLRSGDISGFATNILSAGTAIKSLGPLLAGVQTQLAGIVSEVTAATGGFNLIIAGFAALGVGAAKSSVDMQKSQQDLKALLGVSDEVVQDYTNSAVEMSNGTKQSAADVLDAFTLIGSQAPQLLDDKKGLEEVTRAAQTLAKASGMDLVDAASAITTAMNQMGVEAKDAGMIIDGLSTGAQKGSADIEYQKTAMEKSGAAAKMAGLSYKDLIASIETIAPSFASADVAGSSLKSTLIALETQTESKYKPSVVGINQALANLSAANLTAEEKVNIFGAANLTCATALLENQQGLADMQTALQQTGSASEMADAKSGSFSQTIGALARVFRDFFQTIGQYTVIRDLISLIQYLAIGIGALIQGILWLIRVVFQVVDTFWLFCKAALAMIGQAITPLVNALKTLWSWIKSIGFEHIFNSCVEWCQKALKFFHDFTGALEQYWNKFIGKQTKKTGKPVVQKVKIKQVPEGDVPTGNSGGGNSGNNSSRTSTHNYRGGGSGSHEIQPVKGSLTDLEKKLQDLQKKYKDGLIKLTPEEYKTEVAKIENQIKEKKIKLGLELYVSDNTLSSVSSKLQKYTQKLQILDPEKDSSEIHKIGNEIDALKKRQNSIKLALAIDRANSAILDPNNSLEIVQEAKKNLQDALNNVPFEFNQSLVDQIKLQLKALDDAEYFLKIKIHPELEVPKNSIQGIQDEISKKTKQLNLLDTRKDIDQINQLKHEIEALQKKQEKAKAVTGQGLFVNEGSQKDLSDKISKKKSELEVSVIGSDEYKQLIKEIQELEGKKTKLDIQVESDSLTPAEKKLKKVKKASEATKETFQAMGSMFSSIGQMSDDETATIMQGLASITGSIAEAVPAIMSLVGAKSAEAVANGTAEASKLPFPANIPAIATTVATIMSVIGTIASVAGSFAEGGIISGGSQLGDQMVAKVNSGEMIINGKQQQNLWKAISTGNLGGNTENQISVSNVRVKGSDLYLALKNYSKVKSKSGQFTGIM